MISGDSQPIARAAPGQRQHQRDRGHHHQSGADEVELVAAVVARQALQLHVRQKRRRRRQRHVDPEYHRPVQMLGDESAEHRPAAAGDDPDRAGIGLVVAALARRHRVGDDRLGERHDAAAADALQAAAEDQHQHARRHRARRRARHEHADRDQHHAAPAVDVAELAVERRDRGRGDADRRVTIQDRFSKSPKARPMVGSAVATMVWLSAARNIASARPPMMATTSRRLSMRSTVTSARRIRHPRRSDARRPLCGGLIQRLDAARRNSSAPPRRQHRAAVAGTQWQSRRTGTQPCAAMHLLHPIRPFRRRVRRVLRAAAPRASAWHSERDGEAHRSRQ